MSLILLLTAISCDRLPDAPAPVPEKPAAAVSLESITPIPPNLLTHLTIDSTGTLFWVQENEEHNQIAFSMAPGALPSTTRLSTSAIREALKQPRAAGSIQSLVMGADRVIYFFFTGGTGRTTIAVIGRYSPPSGQVEILTSTKALSAASRLGDSLALARGSLVQTRSQMWLWVRHDLDGALLTLDLNAPEGARLKRPFERVLADGQTLEMRSQKDDLVAGPADALLYFDRPRALIWQINQSGSAVVAAHTGELPPEISTAAIDEKQRIVLLAPDQPSVNDSPLIPSTQPRHNLPAVVIFEDGKPLLIDRPRFSAPQRVSLSTLGTPWLVKDRASYILYNASTGELLRMRVTQP